MLIRLLILIMFFSCSLKKDRQEEVKKSNIIDVSIKKIYNYDTDSFDILVNHKISNDHFVFIKDKELDLFRANILTTIQLFDSKKDSIILQESWENTITENFYNDTRSPNRMFEFSRDISLNEGDYNIKINVQDLDNNNTYSFKDKILLSSEQGFGAVSIYGKNEEIKDSITLENNKIQLEFQYFQKSDIIKDLKIEISNYEKEEKLSFQDIQLNKEGFYGIEFEFPENYYGMIYLHITIESNKITKSFFVYNKKYDLWSQDINEIVGVMRYILPFSEIKLLKEMTIDDKFKYIMDFWSTKDPDTSTEENELLIEFTNRIKYVNLNFSEINRGWKTDKGRVYIIYGKPEDQNIYTNQSDGIYEVWTYESGLKFTFLDRNGFGNFILIKQGL